MQAIPGKNSTTLILTNGFDFARFPKPERCRWCGERKCPSCGQARQRPLCGISIWCHDYKVMMIIMMTMMSFPIISQVSQLSHAWYYQTWQCVDGQHERGQEGKGQGSQWDPGLTHQLHHGVKERRGVEQRLAETFSSEIYSESQWSYCLWRRLNNLEVACIYVWVVCLLTDVDLLILRWKFYWILPPIFCCLFVIFVWGNILHLCEYM